MLKYNKLPAAGLAALFLCTAPAFAQSIWEEEAWDTDADGVALGFCCVVARLRDWARLGLMIARDGRWNGQQVVSRPWIIESTAPARHLSPAYGYQIWLSVNQQPYYAMRGVMGQFVLIDPLSRLVLVQTAVNLAANDPAASAELMSLWRALLAQFGLPGPSGLPR